MGLVFQDVDGNRRRRRVVQFSLIVIGTFLGLFYRLASLQIMQGEALTQRAVKNFLRTEHIEAKRGSILDSEGRPLAVHEATYTLKIHPKKVEEPERLTHALAEKLALNELDTTRLKEALIERKNQRYPAQISIPRLLARDEVARVKVLSAIHSGLEIETAYARIYPDNEVGAHVLGYLGLVSAAELEQNRDGHLTSRSRVGRFGVEATFEAVLAGRPGFKHYAVNAKGRRVDSDWTSAFVDGFAHQRPAVRGKDVVLTINQDVQRILHRNLKGVQSGAAIIMNVHSGDVVGMVSHPGFNPNNWSGGLSRSEKEKIDNNPYHPMVDKTVHSYFPGSLYKIVTAFAGIEEKVITAGDYVDSPGAYEFGQRIFHCHKRSGHGPITLGTALAASADVYFYKLGEKMGIDVLAQYGQKFGFGKKTGININGEQNGLVPTKAFHDQETPGGYQHGLSLSTAVGQGDVRASPIQIAVAYAALVNGGKIVKPRIVSRIQDAHQNLSRALPPTYSAVLEATDPTTFTAIRDGLFRAVWDEKRGTALLAQSKLVKLSGKTGTAQVRQLSRGLNRQTVEEFKHRDHAWFAGYAPVANPSWVIVVFLEHGGSGGKYAAPMAKKMLEDIHRNVPSLLPTPGIESGEGP